jgi:hypothetical protein
MTTHRLMNTARWSSVSRGALLVCAAALPCTLATQSDAASRPSSAVKLTATSPPRTIAAGQTFQITTTVTNPDRRRSLRAVKLGYYISPSQTGKRIRLAGGTPKTMTLKPGRHAKVKRALRIAATARRGGVWVWVCAEQRAPKTKQAKTTKTVSRGCTRSRTRMTITSPVARQAASGGDLLGGPGQQPTVPPAPPPAKAPDVAGALFATSYMSLVAPENLMRETIAQRVLAAAYRRDPDMGTRQATQIVTTVRSLWASRVGPDPAAVTTTAAGSALDEMRDELPAGAGKDAAGDVLRDLRGYVLAQSRAERQVGDVLGIAADSSAPHVTDVVGDTLRKVRAHARDSAAFRSAWEFHFGGPVELDALATVSQIVAATPSLRANEGLLDSLRDPASGTLTTAPAELERAAAGLQDEVIKATDTALAAPVVAGETAGIPAATLDRWKTGLTALTELLRVAGYPEWADKLQRTVGIGLTIYSKVVQLKGVLSAIGSSPFAGALATAGIVVAVAAAVVITGAYVIDAIASRTARKVAESLRAQLARIEELCKRTLVAVGELRETTVEGFRLTFVALEQLARGQRLGNTLISSVNDSVSELRGASAQQLEDGFIRPLLQGTDEYLGRESAPLDAAGFRSGLSLASSFANTFSFDSVSTFPAGVPVDDANLATSLKVHRHALGLLSKVLGRWGHGFTERAPSEHVFRRAALMLVSLMRENPQFAAGPEAQQRLASTLAVGQKLRADQRAVRNPEIAKTAATFAVGKIDELGDAITDDENHALDQFGVKLMGGVDQQVDPPTGTTRAVRCSDAGVIGDMPTITPQLFPYRARVLGRLRGGVRNCVAAHFILNERASTQCSGDTFRYWKYIVRAKVMMLVQIDGAWQQLTATDYVDSDQVLVCQNGPTLEAAIDNTWSQLAGRLSRSPITTSGDAMNAVGVAAEQLLREHARVFYGNVAQNLAAGDLRPPADKVQGSAELIRAVSQHGYGSEMVDNPTLRELVAGADVSNVVAAYAAAAKNPESNPRGGILQALRSNAGKWRDLLVAIGPHAERHTPLDAVLTRLRAGWVLVP